jgi:hypothetical protein
MGGRISDAQWHAFAAAQVETLLLLRQAHGRLMASYDDIKAHATTVSAELEASRAAHAQEMTYLRGTFDAELQMAREAWDGEVQAAREVSAAAAAAAELAQQENAALRKQLTALDATAQQETDRWAAAFSQLRSRYLELAANNRQAMAPPAQPSGQAPEAVTATTSGSANNA